MNIIYICVFHQHGYIDLLKLLIVSLSIKSNINKQTTDILIITSLKFQLLIQEAIKDYNMILHYYILDLHTLMEAACARLNIFEYENINLYDKILYLDTDILINSDINILLNLELLTDKIYVLEEGNIGHPYYSKSRKNNISFSRRPWSSFIKIL
jgi:lipopolysaccharide biosynthesis glycosyltransferase